MVSKPQQFKCPTIGIRLGTTSIASGINHESIPNELDENNIPSFVAFTDEHILVGEDAKIQAKINPNRTISEIMRIIGRNFDDESLQQDMKLLPYQIVEKKNKPQILIKEDSGETRTYSPEQITSILLKDTKKNAEIYLQEEVTNAVITVPAYFNLQQKQSVREAASMAGFNRVKIIAEPIATAIAFGLDKKQKEVNNIIVLDIGGGTFDVTVLNIDNGDFKILATAGDTHLGGENFDQRVLDYLIQVIKMKLNLDISKDRRAIQKLKNEVERAKKSLSQTPETNVLILDVVEGVDFQVKLTQKMFEELNADLFEKILPQIERALVNSGLKKTDISQILLTGGSRKIPKIRQILESLQIQIQEIDEAGVLGASDKGALLCGHKYQESNYFLISNL